MSIVKTRVEEDLNNNRFVITVDWEHGDADLTTCETLEFSGMSDEGLLSWVNSFRELSASISHYRSCGFEDFDREVWSDLGIEIPYDAVYESSNTPPYPTLVKVEWVSDGGLRFSVLGY